MLKIHNLISGRFSPKYFSTNPIEQEKIDLLFEAARWAPSCFNDQPWKFIYSTKDTIESYNKLLSCLVESNQNWAKSAYMLTICLSSKKFSLNGKPNRFNAYDTGMAMCNILHQATDMNLFVHQMGGFNVEKARELLEIPDDFEIISMMAIGYLDEEFLTESLDYKNSRKRKEKETFVFKGKFHDKS